MTMSQLESFTDVDIDESTEPEVTKTRLGTIWKGRKTLLIRVKQSYFFQKEEQKEGKKEEYALFLTN